MKSDHWNFVAKLLGAPGAADPPKSESKPTESAAATDKPTSESVFAAADDDSTPKVEQSPVTPPPKPPSDRSVLDALKDVVRKPSIPGFGRSNDSVSDPSDGKADSPSDATPSILAEIARNETEPDVVATAVGFDVESDSAWNSLAADLGISPQETDYRRPAESVPSSRSPETPDDRQPAKPHKTKSSGGFGTGLGLDLGPDPEPEFDSQQDEAAPASFGSERNLGNDRESRDRDDQPRQHARGQQHDRSETRRPSSDDRPGRRPRDSANEAESDDTSSDSGFGRGRSSLPTDDDQETGRRPRRRQGARQRLSEDEMDRPSSRDVRDDDKDDRPKSSAVDRERPNRDRPEQDNKDRDDSSERTSRRRRGRGEGRGREEKADSSRSDQDNLERDPRDEFDDDIVAGESSGGFGAGLVDDEDSRNEDSRNEDSRNEAETRRPRRRGRRGRRGSSRNETQDRAESQDRDSRADRDEPLTRDPLASPSAFDDDHEDDVEVEVIRRGQRRPRSGDRNRDRNERDDADEPRGGRPRRGGRSRSGEHEPSGDISEQRPTAPTWIETVEIFVEANIENHKKSPRGGGRQRGGRRS